MIQANWSSSTLVATLAAVACFGMTASAADRVSGTLTRTYVIVEDTDLVGDVTCDVGENPCFSFGASDVELRLNGFTITGRADAATGCSGATLPREDGINTNNRNNVSVRGPGLLQQFRRHGVIVLGSTKARVVDLTVSTNCAAGILVGATSFGTLVEGNIAVRNGSSAPGFTWGGICLVGHNSRVRLNEVYGNGYASPVENFGIGVVANGTGNVIELNTVSGNTNGIYVFAGARETLVRENTAVGNPAIQVGNSHPAVRAVDIINLAPEGQTIFDRNVCVTTLNASCVAGPRRQQ